MRAQNIPVNFNVNLWKNKYALKLLNKCKIKNWPNGVFFIKFRAFQKETKPDCNRQQCKHLSIAAKCNSNKHKYILRRPARNLRTHLNDNWFGPWLTSFRTQCEPLNGKIWQNKFARCSVANKSRNAHCKCSCWKTDCRQNGRWTRPYRNFRFWGRFDKISLMIFIISIILDLSRIKALESLSSHRHRRTHTHTHTPPRFASSSSHANSICLRRK